jgi:Diguanylate cyclase, GGDEF domain
MRISGVKGGRWWVPGRSRPLNIREAGDDFDLGSGLPGAGWLERQARELEGRSLADRNAIAILRFRVEDQGLATEEDLVRIADRMRAKLRAYDRLFRVGEREFVLLVPGSDEVTGRELGEQVRSTVGTVALSRGATAQVHCGVSASYEGEPFVFEWVSAKADEALEMAELEGGLAVVASVKAADLHVVAGGTVLAKQCLDGKGDNGEAR